MSSPFTPVEPPLHQPSICHFLLVERFREIFGRAPQGAQITSVWCAACDMAKGATIVMREVRGHFWLSRQWKEEVR